MKPSAYIFVDIDGVLNTRNHLRRQKKESGRCSGKNWCPIACNNLNRICKKYDARIVVSSSWRHDYSLEGLQKIFSSNGIDSEFIVDKIPSSVTVPNDETHCRGHIINEWLEENTTGNPVYIILDDKPIMLDSQADHFVQVSEEDGFANLEAMNRVLEILILAG